MALNATKIATYLEARKPVAGVVIDQTIVPIKEDGHHVSVQELLDRWEWSVSHVAACGCGSH